MALKLYISNKIEALNKRFAEHTKDNSDCFASELIVTQTSGMERWLALESAKQNSIFTNFLFIKPNSFINRLYEMANIEADSLYNTENLKWILFRILDNDDFKTKFEKVAQYYYQDDIKRLQLSVKIADLFDQYLLYRQEYIKAWNTGSLAKVTRQKEDSDKQYANRQKNLDKHQDWQFYLWDKIKQELPNSSFDKVQLRDILIREIENPNFQTQLKAKYGRISLFGLSVITDYHIEIFQRLSQFIDVNLYFLNPAPETYWYDIVSEKFVYYIEKKTGQNIEKLKLHIGNELLSNYSALAKDTYNILFRTDDFVNAIDDSLCIPPSQNTLLEKIQYDIYHNLNKKRTSITLNDLQDESLIISSSYTPMREVEALYNQILHFLDKDTDLQAQDIIVQLSDIDLYTPYIKAVFDNAPHRLPYTIADRSYAGGDTMIGILEMLLKLGAEDFTSEKILQLLNTEFIKNRFGITNLDLIRNVVREANIRFGIKGYAKDDTRYVSWRYGLEKILLGYAIKGGEEYELEEYSTYPLDVIEGSDAEELLRFKAFVDQLILMIDKRTLDRPLSEWKRYVEELIGNLLSIDEKSESEYKYIQKHLLSIENMNDWLEDAIAYDVFQKSFTDALFSNSRAGHFMSGGITFCSMIPMRSIPFKFTAMLGMDADKFPRTETKVAFNLIDVEYKRGDRNTKNNDKYLFLESLLSARKYLYLSYIGNSTKDNSSFNPSLLIDELKTYIELACEKLPTGKQIDDFLVQKHPLHAFSQKYFDKTSSLFTYFSDDFNTKKSEIENTFPEKTTPSENADKIHLNLYELIRFFEDPYQYYYNNVLQIYYQGSSTLLPESEIFELDSLQNYQIQSDLFQSDLEIDKYIDKAKKTGILPLANMANLATKNAYEEIKLIKNQYLKITKNTSPQSIAIDTQLEKVILESFIQPIHNKNYVYSNISSDYSKAKHLLKAWFVHLVLMANKQNIDTVFIAKYYNKPIVFKQDILSAKEARERLNQLSNIYLRGQQKPAAFIPKIAFDFVSNYVKNKADKEKIEQNLQNAFNELHKLDTPNFVGIYNPYIEKESEAGYFADNKYVKDSLKEASLLVYADIIHLV